MDPQWILLDTCKSPWHLKPEVPDIVRLSLTITQVIKMLAWIFAQCLLSARTIPALFTRINFTIGVGVSKMASAARTNLSMSMTLVFQDQVMFTYSPIATLATFSIGTARTWGAGSACWWDDDVVPWRLGPGSSKWCGLDRSAWSTVTPSYRTTINRASARFVIPSRITPTHSCSRRVNLKSLAKCHSSWNNAYRTVHHHIIPDNSCWLHMVLEYMMSWLRRQGSEGQEMSTNWPWQGRSYCLRFFSNQRSLFPHNQD